MSTYYHITTENALKSILKDGLKPDIGPLSAIMHEHDKRVYMFKDKNDMYGAIDNWLIDDLECIHGEDAAFCILAINVPDDFPITHGNVGYEFYSYETIPPEFITVEERL